MFYNLIKEDKKDCIECNNNNYNKLLDEIFNVPEEESIKGNKYNFSLNDFDEKGNIKK